MEHVAGAVTIDAHKDISAHFQRWKEDLEDVVAKFHAAGFVHGDLRDANIIVGEDGRVRLIDFDWGGKDEQVKYPAHISQLNQELVRERYSQDERITKEDDLRVLNKTLEKILRNQMHSS